MLYVSSKGKCFVAALSVFRGRETVLQGRKVSSEVGEGFLAEERFDEE